jgi:hypothetical protein
MLLLVVVVVVLFSFSQFFFLGGGGGPPVCFVFGVLVFVCFCLFVWAILQFPDEFPKEKNSSFSSSRVIKT